MKVIRSIFKLAFYVVMLSIFPLWVATSLDLHVGAFLITFDFIVLLLIVAADDHAKGRKSTYTSKIRFPFPFYNSDF